MAGHRSPRGRHARRHSDAVPVRDLIAGGTRSSGPSLRTTVLVTAAAVGSVATGTFTALVPTAGDGLFAEAVADEAAVAATLTTATAPLVAIATSGHLAPVAFADVEGFAVADQHLERLGKATDIATAIATELAEQLAREQAAQEQRDRLDAIISKGGVDGWIAEALQVLDLPQSLAPGVKKVIMAESGGNPRAINNWDSNARAGRPSQGLMQTIPSTFRAFVHDDLADRSIRDPVANITAGVSYMIATYGVDTLESGGRSNNSGGYVGY